jgi:hypothetical protein
MKKLIAITVFMVLAAFATSHAATILWDHSGGADGFVIYYWRSDKPPADKHNWDDPNLGYLKVEDGTVRQLAFPDENMMQGVEYTFEGTAFKYEGGESARSNQATYSGGAFAQPPFTPPGADKLLPVEIKIPSMTIQIGQ